MINFDSLKKQNNMKRTILSTLCIAMFATLAFSQQEIKLYPDGAAENNNLTESKTDNGLIKNISEARMYAYVVPKNKSNGTAVLICPGGGYAGLSTIKEGSDIAKWYNKLGISAFVLYYRMPNGNKHIPLKDAQTAMKIIYHQSKKWNIDENKIGIMGFSAGGHLASTVGTHFTSKETRPAFMVLAYPVISMKNKITHKPSRQNLLGNNPTQVEVDEFSNEQKVTKNTPPTFIFHAKDDATVSVENSKIFYRTLLKNNVRAEFKIYENGGHGFGMNKQGLDIDEWPNELNRWLDSENLL